MHAPLTIPAKVMLASTPSSVGQKLELLNCQDEPSRPGRLRNSLEVEIAKASAGIEEVATTAAGGAATTPGWGTAAAATAAATGGAATTPGWGTAAAAAAAAVAGIPAAELEATATGSVNVTRGACTAAAAPGDGAAGIGKAECVGEGTITTEAKLFCTNSELAAAAGGRAGT